MLILIEIFICIIFCFKTININALSCYSCKNCSDPFTEYMSGFDVVDCTKFIVETYGNDYEQNYGPIAKPTCAVISKFVFI